MARTHFKFSNPKHKKPTSNKGPTSFADVRLLIGLAIFIAMFFGLTMELWAR